MIEFWINIADTDGRYAVSNLGNVRANWSDVPQRHLKTRKRIEKQTLLKAWVHTTGYKRIGLGRNKSFYIHRLVATCFLPNPDNLPQVDHIDGDRTNNTVTNLRWVSAKTNAHYGGERHGWNTQKAASTKRRIHDKKVAEYRALIEKGHSLRYVAWLFGTSHSSVKRALTHY
jgi:hypothetical protein